MEKIFEIAKRCYCNSCREYGLCRDEEDIVRGNVLCLSACIVIMFVVESSGGDGRRAS